MISPLFAVELKLISVTILPGDGNACISDTHQHTFGSDATWINISEGQQWGGGAGNDLSEHP